MFHLPFAYNCFVVNASIIVLCTYLISIIIQGSKKTKEHHSWIPQLSCKDGQWGVDRLKRKRNKVSILKSPRTVIPSLYALIQPTELNTNWGF